MIKEKEDLYKKGREEIESKLNTLMEDIFDIETNSKIIFERIIIRLLKNYIPTEYNEFITRTYFRIKGVGLRCIDDSMQKRYKDIVPYNVVLENYMEFNLKKPIVFNNNLLNRFLKEAGIEFTEHQIPEKNQNCRIMQINVKLEMLDLPKLKEYLSKIYYPKQYPEKFGKSKQKTKK